MPVYEVRVALLPRAAKADTKPIGMQSWASIKAEHRRQQRGDAADESATSGSVGERSPISIEFTDASGRRRLRMPTATCTAVKAFDGSGIVEPGRGQAEETHRSSGSSMLATFSMSHLRTFYVASGRSFLAGFARPGANANSYPSHRHLSRRFTVLTMPRRHTYGSPSVTEVS